MMYCPPHFQQNDQTKIFEFLKSNSFGTLFSSHEGTSYATHLPFVIEKEGSDFVLLGHFARGNEHHRVVDGREVLVTFLGPHAYVPARLFGTPDAVPTWNYATVHMTGVLRFFLEESELSAMLHRLVSQYDGPDSQAYSPERPAHQKLHQGIAGFRIDVSRVEAKWKMSQNKSQEVRDAIVAYLQSSEFSLDRDVAEIMEKG